MVLGLGWLQQQFIAASEGLFEAIVWQPVVSRRGTPHVPAVIVGIACIETKQAAGLGRHVHAALGHGRLKDYWFTHVSRPEHLTGLGGKAVNLARARPDKY